MQNISNKQMEIIYLAFPLPSFLKETQMHKVTAHLQWDIPLFFTYKETKETEEKTALTVQLPALRFCKAPAAASRVLKFWLSVRMERYSRTTSGWYNNSKPAGGARREQKEEKHRRQCINKHIPLFNLIREQPSVLFCYNTERRASATSRTFYTPLLEMVETATHAENVHLGWKSLCLSWGWQFFLESVLCYKLPSMQVMTRWQETIFACNNSYFTSLDWVANSPCTPVLIQISLNTFRDTKNRAKESELHHPVSHALHTPRGQKEEAGCHRDQDPKCEGQGETLTPVQIFSTETHHHHPTLGDCESHICSLQVPRVTVSAVQFKHDRNESYSQLCQGFPFVMLSNWQQHRVQTSSSIGLGLMHLPTLKRGS